MKIYTLADSSTNEIRYIGFTTQSLGKRLYQHMWDSKNKKNRYVCKWINSLKTSPKIELLEDVTLENWEEREVYWIQQFKYWGFNLTNTHKGGKGVNPKNRENTYKNKSIDVYDKYGNFIKNYPSIRSASISLNISNTSLCNALHKKTSPIINDKYRVCYKDEKLKPFTIYGVDYHKGQNKFISLRELCKNLKICRNKVSKALNGNSMCVYGKYTIYKDIVYPS